jgi:hypothetical protein
MRHHIIPQFYLREFRDPAADPRGGPRVWVADLLRGTVALRSPKAIAKITDYYGVQKEDGSVDQFFETEVLRRVEDAVAPLFAKLRAGQYQLAAEERVKLIEFMVLLRTRVPGWRNQVEALAGDVAQAWIRVAAQHPGYFERVLRKGNRDIEFSRERIEEVRCSALDPTAFEYRGTPDLSLSSMLNVAARLAPILYEMAWVFVTPPPGRHFVACDNPVQWYDCTAADPLDHTLLSENGVLIFPINPRGCLVAAWRNRFPHSSPANDAIVSRLNDRAVRAAERYVFAADRSDAENAVALRRTMEERGEAVGYPSRDVMTLKDDAEGILLWVR